MACINYCMKLIVNEFGAYLSKNENRFVIKTKEKEFHTQNKGIKECNIHRLLRYCD